MDQCVGGGQHGVPRVGGGGLQPGFEVGQGGQGEAWMHGNDAANPVEVLHVERKNSGPGSPLSGTKSMGADCHL